MSAVVAMGPFQDDVFWEWISRIEGMGLRSCRVCVRVPATVQILNELQLGSDGIWLVLRRPDMYQPTKFV